MACHLKTTSVDGNSQILSRRRIEERLQKRSCAQTNLCDANSYETFEVFFQERQCRKTPLLEHITNLELQDLSGIMGRCFQDKFSCLGGALVFQVKKLSQAVDGNDQWLDLGKNIGLN